MARASSPGQYDSDHEVTFGTDGERWCACDKCFESELAVEEETKGHNLLREIEERSKQREQTTIKQNSRVQNYFLNQCRMLDKQQNDVKKRLKRETVSNILENYALLREAEKFQDDHFFEEGQSVTKKKESYSSVRKCDVPTVRIRDEESSSTKTVSKQILKKAEGTKGFSLRLHNMSQPSIFSMKGESWKRYEERKQGITPDCEKSKVLSKTCESPQTFEQSDRYRPFRPHSQSCPLDFQKCRIKPDKRIEDTDSNTNNRSLSQLEGEYFHEKIQNFFQRKNSNSPQAMKSPCDHVSPILPRKSDRFPTNNAIACKKHEFLIDAAKSGYKWIFTPGTENEIQRGQNQNVNMKEKIKIRSSELADIKQELKRNERNLNRLVRRSHNLVKDIF